MSSPRLTPWFPPEIKPVRVGVYQRDMTYCYFSGAGSYSLWNGDAWCGWGGSIAIAARNNEPSSYQDAPWRGLTKPARKA